MSIIHTGINKCLSNEAILENYATSIAGMKCYHDFLVQSQGMDENLSPPVEVAVNRNNISVMEKAILEVHKMEPNSVYGRIHKSPYRGIMHDGITKYSTELNGVYLRD